MAPLLSWSEKMSVGVEALDADHRKLMSYVNDLHAAVRGRAAPADVGRILDELIAYTEYHFEVEERLQKLARYPHLEDHRQAHEALKQKVYALRERFRADPKSLNSIKVFDFLTDWLVRHILGDDMKYKPFLERKPATAAAAAPAAVAAPASPAAPAVPPKPKDEAGSD